MQVGKPLQAGKLRHRIKVYAVPVVQSSTGAPIPATGDDRTLVCEAWAEITRPAKRLPVGSAVGEKTSTGQLFSEFVQEIHLRYFPGITPAMEVDFAGRTLNIVEVEDVDNRHRELILTTWEHFTIATP